MNFLEMIGFLAIAFIPVWAFCRLEWSFGRDQQKTRYRDKWDFKTHFWHFFVVNQEV